MENLQIASRILNIQQRIDRACQASNRSENEVQLLAVSKTKPMSMLEDAYQAGQRHFGENYAQEAIEKSQSPSLAEATWHFIGPLQSNKTRGIAEHVDWVHTLDRTKIAQRLSDQRPADRGPLNVLIQVNISHDPAKAGVLPSQVESFAAKVSQLPNLCLKGLMTITAQGLSENELTAQFSELKNLQSTLIKQHSSCTELSMGMSQDFEIAIGCGATIVRVGSDIFGARAPKPEQTET
jgi:pyridoxal phosphate enzyme (YggS family)